MIRAGKLAFAMPTKPLKTRKLPMQTRARVSVDAILEASAQILVEGGYKKFSTNKVARRAGVSIGTLYQYFPNKESLIAAIQQKHLDELTAIAHTAFARMKEQDLRAAIRTLVEANIAAHTVSPKLHKVLLEEVPRLGAHGEEDELIRMVEQGLSELLRRHRDRIAVSDTRLAIFLVGHIIGSTVHAAVQERPASIRSGALTKELVRVVSGYLLHGQME